MSRQHSLPLLLNDGNGSAVPLKRLSLQGGPDVVTEADLQALLFNFSTALGITSHAFLTSLVSTPLFILTAFLKPYGTLDLENPLASNLAVLLPDDAAKWLVALCKSIDLFAVWILILLAIGFTAVNPKKLKGAKPFAIAFTVWAVFVVIRVGFAFIFS